MNKTLVGLVLLLAIMPLAAAASNNLVDVTLLSYTPTPAQPGDMLDVYIQATNTDTEPAEEVAIELLPNAAFSPEGQARISAGTIAAGNTYVAKFRVKVSTDASAGERILTARTSQKGVASQNTELEITIAADDAAVFITDVRTSPSTIEPGKDAEVTLVVENLADARLRDVTVTLDLEDTPFVAVDGTARKKVSVLTPRSSASIKYSLVATPTATANVYQIPVEISFLDEQGSTQTQEDNIGLRINTEAYTKAYLDDVTRTNGEVQVSIRIVNKGLSEVKFLEVMVNDGSNYDVRAQDEQVYVGNIDSDDWETVRVKVTTEATSIEMPLEYSYRDAYNEEHTVEDTFAFDIPAQQQGNGATTWIIIIVVVVVIVVIVIARRRKKKNRKR